MPLGAPSIADFDRIAGQARLQPGAIDPRPDREPATSRTRMMGPDMLACMLGDVYTDVEKTMIELQRQALVHETRSAFQQAMQHRFISAVERLTGRRVAQFISTHGVGPDLELELFVLEPASGDD